MSKFRFNFACIAMIAALQVSSSHGFLAPQGLRPSPAKILYSTAEDTSSEEKEPSYVEAVPTLSSVTDPEAIRLREELFKLSEDTSKGFQASSRQRQRAREIIADLARFNPTKEPAAPYYENANATETSAVSLAGKWDLIYTDAPDITSLDTSWNPLATAKLGRIGQECTPPFIKNVIEWRKPDWADQVPLPFAGSKDSRILQKVCTKATANPNKPMLVNLEVAGIELVAPPPLTTSNGKNNLQQDIEEEGLPVGLLRNNPLELRGPLTAPFGQFEVLYLDEELRIVRTSQNYLAVNRRAREEWF